jgi:ligand-binding sensor domain-containing protein/DNA-binding CsgD family transcriptional regulator
MVAQANNGWLYFANSAGLLEFDGVYWKTYSVNNQIVRSLKIVDDRIYVGGTSEFGYFERDEIGSFVYHSISQTLPNWWGQVWNIFQAKNTIYFLDDTNINVYTSDSKVKTIPTNMKIDCSAMIQDRLYLGSTEGLFLYDGDTLTKVAINSNELVGQKIVGINSYKDRILVTTSKSGLYFIENQKCEKVYSIATRFIEQNQLFCSVVSGSKVVLGSVRNGAFIFDLENPTYYNAFNLSNGLKNNTILSLLFDKDENLWLGLDKGLGYVELKSSVRPLFSVNSPIGTGYCSITYNNELYLGTNQGLYKLDASGNYQMITNSDGQVWSLSIIQGSLFSCGDNGILVITPQQTYQIDIGGAWEAHLLSANPDRILVGTYTGLKGLQKLAGIWRFVYDVSEFRHSARGFIEDETPNVFWIANTNQDIQRLTIDSNNGNLLNIKKYGLKNAQIGYNVFFRKVQNNLIICADKGIFQYSPISDEFIKYSQLEGILDGDKYYEYLNADSRGNIWFVSDKNMKTLLKTSEGYLQPSYNWGLRNELVNGFENVSLLDSVSAIVGVDNAYIKIDLSKNNIESSNVNVFIRNMLVTHEDSIIEYNANRKIALPYGHNSFSVFFAATEYAHSDDVFYSYRLYGVDEKWSKPSRKAFKEYMNLPEGEYTFEVRAFIDGQESRAGVATITFEILPPWYRSIWAYLVYTLFVITFFVVLYGKTIKKQQLIILQKGEELEKQTKIYEKERILKDKEIYELQNQNLRTTLNYKTQELTGHVLNLVRKNEILEDVKREVLSITKAIDENKQQGAIKQKLTRLTSQINNNIEHDKDFELFQSNFNVIHRDFFKLLEEKYPKLTRNDKILCAYLKMNLSSKEIAPLQNITVRGVEVNRYRLRKKMDLDRDINLTEFLQGLSHNKERKEVRGDG